MYWFRGGGKGIPSVRRRMRFRLPCLPSTCLRAMHGFERLTDMPSTTPPLLPLSPRTTEPQLRLTAEGLGLRGQLTWLGHPVSELVHRIIAFPTPLKRKHIQQPSDSRGNTHTHTREGGYRKPDSALPCQTDLWQLVAYYRPQNLGRTEAQEKSLKPSTRPRQDDAANLACYKVSSQPGEWLGFLSTKWLSGLTP